MLLSQPLTGWICRVCPRLRGVLGAVAAQVLPLLRRVVRITLHGAPEGQTLGGLLQGRPNKTIFKSIFHYSILGQYAEIREAVLTNIHRQTREKSE